MTGTPLASPPVSPGTASGSPAAPRWSKHRLLRRVVDRRMARFALGVLAVLILAAVFGPMLWDASPVTLHPRARLEPPSWEHPLGTDVHGRDELARLLEGARHSLVLVVVVLVLAVAAGVVLGVAAGFGTRLLDTLICRVCDVLLAFPPLVAALVVLTVLGPGLVALTAAVAASFVGEFARFARSYTLAARDRPVITVARMAGVPGWRIAISHVLPETCSKVLVLASMLAGHVLVTVAGLSYLGFGAQPPTAEWGVMLSDAQNYLGVAPWLVYAPAGALVLLVLACNVLGIALDDAGRGRQP